MAIASTLESNNSDVVGVGSGRHMIVFRFHFVILDSSVVHYFGQLTKNDLLRQIVLHPRTEWHRHRRTLIFVP